MVPTGPGKKSWFWQALLALWVIVINILYYWQFRDLLVARLPALKGLPW